MVLRVRVLAHSFSIGGRAAERRQGGVVEKEEGRKREREREGWKARERGRIGRKV